MKRQRLLEEWNKFSAEAIPLDCEPTSRRQYKIAFYSGAAMLYHLFMNSLTTGPKDDDPKDLEMMACIDGEIKSFINDLLIEKMTGQKRF